MNTESPLSHTTTSFGLVLREEQDPKRVYLVRNREDPNGGPDVTAKPSGWGLPGGGMDSIRDKKNPLNTAIEETRREAGLVTRLATHVEDSISGEVLKQEKIRINNTVFVFHLEEDPDEKPVRIQETDETDACGSFTLEAILRMPLAIGENGEKLDPNGIYFSHRVRIFLALNKLEYNILQMIPGLHKESTGCGGFDIFVNDYLIDPAEVGDDVYWILSDALDEAEEVSADDPSDSEIPDMPGTSSPDDEWRRWAEQSPARSA